MKKLIALCVLFLTSCTNSSHSKKILESNGYTDVIMTGYSYFGCGDHDVYHDGFTAKSPNGNTVTGVVCTGYGIGHKNSTIRFE